MKKYLVTLTDEERQQLEPLLAKGKAAARTLRHAQALLTGQCLNRRIGSKEELVREVSAWERPRNEAEARIDWRFTTADARIKLKRLYPTIMT